MKEGLSEQSPATGRTAQTSAGVGRRWSVQRVGRLWSVQRAGRGLGRTLDTQYPARVSGPGSTRLAAGSGVPTRTTAANR